MDKLLLTEDVITKLGFGKYWGDCGDSGTRSLLEVPGTDFPVLMRIHEIDQKDDECDGYGIGTPRYLANCFTDNNFSYIYFLHELWESALKDFPAAIPVLTKNAKKYNIYPYVEDYLKSKENG